MDNIKAMLIILVVVGHLLELFLKSGNVKTIYKIIYSFHMPLFIFISGYFAKFNLKKIITGLVVPYMIFQAAYILYVNYIIDSEKDVDHVVYDGDGCMVSFGAADIKGRKEDTYCDYGYFAGFKPWGRIYS